MTLNKSNIAIIFFIIPITWAGSFIAAKYVVAEISPLESVFWRFFLSAIVMYPFFSSSGAVGVSMVKNAQKKQTEDCFLDAHGIACRLKITLRWLFTNLTLIELSNGKYRKT